MKKLNYFSISCLMALSSANLLAQTDVTDQYLINPSFEQLKAADGNSPVTVKAALENGLYGWEFDNISGMSNYQIESLASGSSTGFPADGSGKVAPSDGTYYYFNRQGWAHRTSALITTTKEAVEPGLYYIAFDYKAADYSNNNASDKNGTTMNIKITCGDAVLLETQAAKRSYSCANNSSNPGSDTYMVDAPWTEMGALFKVTESGKVTFRVGQNMVNSGRSDIMLDNFRLYRIDGTEDVSADIRGVIVNPSFEAGNGNGWNYGVFSDTKVVKNTGTVYPMTNVDGNYLFNTYSGTAETVNLEQTVKDMQEGMYLIKAVISGWDTTNDITLFADETEVKVNTSGGEKTGVEVELEFAHSKFGDMTFGVKGTQFFKVDNVRLYYRGELKGEAAVQAKKAELWTVVDKMYDMANTSNYGNEVFFIANEKRDSFIEAADQGAMLCYDENAELGQLNDMISNLNQAIADYQNVELNKPEEGQAYCIVLNDNGGWEYDGKAVSWNINETLTGGYELKYANEPNSIFSQALFFEEADGLNCYKIWFYDIEGIKRYFVTGTVYGGNNYQIRTSDDSSQAMTFKIESDAYGNIKLYNIAASTYLGSQDSGVYTVNSHTNFAVSETEKAKVSLELNDTYSTLILPFDAEIPAGLLAYTCSAVEDNVLKLESVSSIKANVPYIIEDATPDVSDDNIFDFEGYGSAYYKSYSDGFLTGVFEKMRISENGFTLKVEGDKGTGFYRTGGNDWADAFSAYLDPEETLNEDFYFIKEKGLSVDGISSDVDKTVNVYDINGVCVRKGVSMKGAFEGLRRGIYIVDGVKYVVR